MHAIGAAQVDCNMTSAWLWCAAGEKEWRCVHAQDSDALLATNALSGRAAKSSTSTRSLNPSALSRAASALPMNPAAPVMVIIGTKVLSHSAP